ncbi:MAG: hypothetical protein LBP86_06760 [Azoarcus sp.]|jgi:hypothetical protein|nr:hypothetical protein [Azoarcus sp.]
MKAEQHAVAVLGDEYDDKLRDALRVVLEKNGTVATDKFWGVGGSQEIERVQVSLGEDSITIESETFVGLTISGPQAVIDEIASQVRKQMSG